MPQVNKPKFIKILIATALVLSLFCVSFVSVRAFSATSFSPTDGGTATASQNLTITFDEDCATAASDYVTVYESN